MRYKTGNDAESRRNSECNGYRNWDTAATCIAVRNDKRCFDFAQRNADRLLAMKKLDKIKLLERNSSYGFGGVSARNVDYRELNQTLREIGQRGKR